MQKIIHNRHFARALNRYLGLADPIPPSIENNFEGGYGCRWCEFTGRWVVILPRVAAAKLDFIESHFKLHGLETLRLPAPSGNGIELSGYVYGQGPSLH